MLNDRDGEDSLGHMYRLLYARVCRAVSKAMRWSDTTGTSIDELRFRLQAFDDIVGANKGSLDELEKEDAATAGCIRDFFAKLLREFDHIEVMIGLRPAPSDGSPPRQDSIMHFKNLLLTKPSENAAGGTTLSEVTRLVTTFVNARDQRSQGSSRSSVNPGSASGVEDHSQFSGDAPNSKGEARSSSNAVTPHYPQSPDPHVQSWVAASGSGLPAAAGSPASATSPNSPWPSITQLLSHPDNSLQTPSTISAISSPITPYTPYQGAQPAINVVSTPGTSGPDQNFDRQRDDSIMAWSPVQSNEPLPSSRNQPMEPRTESSMESQLRGRSTNLGLEFFSTGPDYRSKGSPGASHEPSP